MCKQILSIKKLDKQLKIEIRWEPPSDGSLYARLLVQIYFVILKFS
jgi:hypothetical protein